MIDRKNGERITKRIERLVAEGKVARADPNGTAFRQSMAFNAEAARAGLFAAAQDIAEAMQKANIPNGEAALLTGAVEMACQLWMQVMLQAPGVTRQKARAKLIEQVRTFANKHSRPEDRPEAVAS